VARLATADRLHSAAVLGLPGDRETLRAGQRRRLRLLRVTLAVLVGVPVVSGVRHRRPPGDLASGQSEARRTRGDGRLAGRRPPPGAGRAGAARRQRLRWPRVRNLRHRTPRGRSSCAIVGAGPYTKRPPLQTAFGRRAEWLSRRTCAKRTSRDTDVRVRRTDHSDFVKPSWWTLVSTTRRAAGLDSATIVPPRARRP